MTEVLSFQCPSCGSEVRVGSPCPGCKKPPQKRKPQKSWQQEDLYDGLDLPDNDFDYDEFVAREFGRKPHRSLRVKWYWWLLGVLLIGLMVVGIGLGLFP